MFLEIINCKKFCINIDCSIRESISAIEEGGFKIALVIDKEDNLIGTICDGDIRRALLKNLTIESPISKIIQKNKTLAKQSPQNSKKITSKNKGNVNASKTSPASKPVDKKEKETKN